MDSKIVQGQITPIKASALRNLTLQVPLPVPEGVHQPQLISQDPLVVAPETIAFARKTAQRIVGDLASLPVSEPAAEMIAMAFTILHFTKEK